MLALLLALVGFTAVHRNTRIFSFQNPTRCHSISTEGDSDAGLRDESRLVEPVLAGATEPLAPLPAAFDALPALAFAESVAHCGSPQPLPRPPSIS